MRTEYRVAIVLLALFMLVPSSLALSQTFTWSIKTGLVQDPLLGYGRLACRSTWQGGIGGCKYSISASAVPVTDHQDQFLGTTQNCDTMPVGSVCKISWSNSGDWIATGGPTDSPPIGFVDDVDTMDSGFAGVGVGVPGRYMGIIRGVSCTLVQVAGSCGSVPYSCASGTLQSRFMRYWDYTAGFGSSTDYVWNCNGLNGGANAPCSSSIPRTNGVCGTDINSCEFGTLDEIADNSTHKRWNCDGVNGGAQSQCSVHVLCGTDLNECASATLQDVPDSSTHYLWNCTKGDVTASCSRHKPVNGVCGASGCTAGKFVDATDDSNNYRWNCDGLYGGAAASCTTQRPRTNGICGCGINACTVGALEDLNDSAYEYLWRCRGINGGDSPGCNYPKSSQLFVGVACDIIPTIEACKISGSSCINQGFQILSYTQPHRIQFDETGDYKIRYRVRYNCQLDTARNDLGHRAISSEYPNFRKTGISAEDKIIHVIGPNNPPTQPKVAVTPCCPLPNDTLTCSVSIPSVDPDGDAFDYTYNWYRDGALMYSLTKAETIDTIASNTYRPKDAGEQWYCTVTPRDSKGLAGVRGSDQVTIQSFCTLTDGTCGPTLNTCTKGSFKDVQDNSTHYLWKCLGIEGGTNVSCNSKKVGINGICGSALDTCASGIYRDIGDNSTHYLWECLGSGGGTSDSCSRSKAACGNNNREGDEACDGTDSISCPDQCIAPGQPSECTCPYGQMCGNDIKEGLEECDGFDKDNCTSGACTSECTCAPECDHDDIREGAEECDGTDVSNCHATSMCTSSCTCVSTPASCDNDDKREGDEICDGADAAACPDACTLSCTCTSGESINGICDPNALNRCIAGTFQDAPDTSDYSFWNCAGLNGGVTAHNCKYPFVFDGMFNPPYNKTGEVASFNIHFSDNSIAPDSYTQINWIFSNTGSSGDCIGGTPTFTWTPPVNPHPVSKKGIDSVANVLVKVLPGKSCKFVLKAVAPDGTIVRHGYALMDTLTAAGRTIAPEAEIPEIPAIIHPTSIYSSKRADAATAYDSAHVVVDSLNAACSAGCSDLAKTKLSEAKTYLNAASLFLDSCTDGRPTCATSQYYSARAKELASEGLSV